MRSPWGRKRFDDLPIAAGSQRDDAGFESNVTEQHGEQMGAVLAIAKAVGQGSSGSMRRVIVLLAARHVANVVADPTGEDPRFGRRLRQPASQFRDEPLAFRRAFGSPGQQILFPSVYGVPVRERRTRNLHPAIIIHAGPVARPQRPQ